MQSKTWVIPLVVALCVSLTCAALAIWFRGEDGALLLTVLAGFVLGFVFPRGAWRWAVILALWMPVAVAVKAPLHAGPSWCPALTFPPRNVLWGLPIVPVVAVFLGVIADWFVSEALRWLGFLGWRWLANMKLILRAAVVALAAFFVLSCALMLAQPLQPYAIGQRYCWDESCFSVTSVKRTKSIGSDVHRAVARGTFYVVTANMETPWWGRFYWSNDAVYATDYSGTDYRNSSAGQLASDALLRSNRSQCHLIRGAGEAETIVFDLPDDAIQPRLLVRDTLGFEGLLGGLRSSLFYVKPAFNLRYD